MGWPAWLLVQLAWLPLLLCLLGTAQCLVTLPPTPAHHPHHTPPTPPSHCLQLKVKMAELLEVYRQQDGATGVRKVPQATVSGSSSGGGGLLARLRGTTGSGSVGGSGSGSGRPK